jgi:hypothetical protein
VIAIEIDDPATGVVSFSLDGERVGEAKVPSLARAQKYVFSLYGQAAKDQAVKFAVEEARVYVRREGAAGTPKPGGGY